MKNIIVIAVAALSLGVLAVEPEISALNVTQNSSRLVTITYTLSAKAIVTLDMTTNGVSIGSSNFQTVFDPTEPQGGSPVNKIVAAGTHTILWRPRREWPNHVFKNGEFKVELRAWPLSSPPDYMVVDLVTPSNRWFYVSVNDIPGGIKMPADATNEAEVAALQSDEYRTTKLVMRRIPAAGNQWLMGAPSDESQYKYWFNDDKTKDPELQHYVTLTEDYYMAIYELTSLQRRHIMGMDNYGDVDVDKTGWKFTPITPPSCTYNRMRGNPTEATSCNWPSDGHAVDAASELAKFRAFTGLMLDLPTEAQWEYACRAGTSGPLYNNDSSKVNEIAWTKSNNDIRPMPVGLLLPNGWGLYDMIGNQCEWTLDQRGWPTADPAVDPKGATDTPDKRVLRGGSYLWIWQRFGRAAARRDLAPNCTTDSGWGGLVGGVRLCCPIAIPEE